jgi:hypothetical protein
VYFYMKKKIIGGIAIAAVALALAFNLIVKQDSNNLSELTMANMEALAGSEYHLGQPGTNWQTYTISCTVAQQNSTGYSWYWDIETQAYVYGIPVGTGTGGGGSNSSEIIYAPMTYSKDVCGAGLGICLSDAPSGHPCA